MYFTASQLNVLKKSWIFGLIALFIYVLFLATSDGDPVSYSNFSQKYIFSKYTKTMDGWKMSLFCFTIISALIWFAESIIERNPKKIGIMLGGFLVMFGVLGLAYYFNLKEEEGLRYFVTMLLNGFVLFAVFHALANEKNLQMIGWSLLAGIFINYCIGSAQSYWMHRGILARITPIVKYFNCFVVFLIPTMVYGILYSIQNYGNTTTREEVKIRFFEQMYPVEKKEYLFIFPVLFTLLISILARFNQSFPFFLGSILRFFKDIGIDVGFLRNATFTINFLISTFILVVLSIGTTNFVIRRLKTIKKTVSWSFLFSFVPFINVIPYYNLVTTKPRMQDDEVYIREIEREHSRLNDQLCIFLIIYLLIMGIWDFSSAARYGSQATDGILLTRFLQLVIGMLFLYQIRRSFKFFYVILGTTLLGVGFIALSDNAQYQRLLLSIVGTSIFLWYVIGKAFHVEWWEEEIKEDAVLSEEE